MTGTSYLYKDYMELAHKIKDDIKNLYGFTVNVGIGNNKLCAKWLLILKSQIKYIHYIKMK